ncbi:hypothetical protein [Flavobacterium stagni]|uniref:Uncharacterized protein n=1 Tax=Flavobacterium stagni TaxID=2506421 RepID=A0A4Q1K3T9_9FLAO|nr:hypothetical protein [Flavobacterium stagni]RXR20182.1 hypothetical protein EQG61_13105 [Flavobacterium stagni]
MAKSSSIISIEGSVENLTFYRKDGKNYVRRRSTMSGERIKNDPSFKRTRENMSEFGLSMNAAGLLRKSVGSLLFKAKNNKLNNRLMTHLTQIKKLDAVSVRGQRLVANGLQTPEGKAILKGFDFNETGQLSEIVFIPIQLDNATGVVTITDLITEENILAPRGASHINFQTAVLNLDFVTEEHQLTYSNVESRPLESMVPTDVTLTPTAMPVGTGIVFYLLLITFSQEINGVFYPLKNEEYSSLNILEVL